MTRRCLHIGIRTKAERTRAVRAALHRAHQGEHTPQEAGLYFESVEELRRILTDKRLDLLVEIARSKPESVRALADQLGRDYKNVSEDVNLLGQLGLIELEEQGGRGKPQAPTLPYDEIRVTIALRPHETAHAA
jgi:predicted transcriptional regulator